MTPRFRYDINLSRNDDKKLKEKQENYMLPNDISIRRYQTGDREEVRRISCQTAFLERERKLFFDDDEILADALTLYFTDFEPDSCLVALDGKRVVGYIFGSINVKRMNSIFAKKILLRSISKALCKGIFLRRGNLKFFIHVTLSFLKGEFFAPDFSGKYPATLHINIDQDYRGHRLGKRLMESYLAYLRGKRVPGVHLGTMSENAKKFFIKSGLSILFKGKRSYLRYILKRDVSYYILGKIL